MTKLSHIPKKQGLYDFANEHDSCGVGFVADIKGRKTQEIVQKGITVLERLLHRGALGGDNKTGDGAGILLQIPDEFFRTDAGLETELPPYGEYAAGMLFLPVGKKASSACAKVCEQSIKEQGLELLGWRKVPHDCSCLGVQAARSCPDIRQLFIARGGLRGDSNAFERELFVLRRKIEKRIEETLPKLGAGFYIVSMSSRTITYKGLLQASQIPPFYPDLGRKSFKSALALVHQRYSTNTFPTWPLAQPFRYLAHNGEINTLRGNINQMLARQCSFESSLFGEKTGDLLPVTRAGQSDSACLDNALELLFSCGRSLLHSMMMLIPEAWGKKHHVGHDIRGFFDFHAGLMEPWDGPAAVAFSDGRSIGALLDRNGLRPARYTVSRDGFIVLASEAGVIDIPPEQIESKGRLGPGQIIYVDLERNRVIFDDEVKSHIARRRPYRRWVEENRISLHGLFDSVVAPEIDEDRLLRRQMLFGYTREEVNMIIKVMAETGHEPTGSMGNDASLAVLSQKPQLLYAYFKQLFAQVTNPAIDPIRESLVMSLTTFLGRQENILQEVPRQAHLLKLERPILTEEDLQRIRRSPLHSFESETIQMSFFSGRRGKALEPAVQKLCEDAEKAIRNGKSVIILSDRDTPEKQTPMPALLAVSALNRHLIEKGLRTLAGIVVETGEAREIMHFALLFGYGANAICPYLVFETVVSLVRDRRIDGDISYTKAMENYIRAASKGILKIMSKMGISTLRSYRGAQVFEAVGLDRKMVERYFTGTASRIGGVGMEDISREANARFRNANCPDPATRGILPAGGQYHFRKNEEKHLWTPETISKLQRAARTNDYSLYKEYAGYINDQAEHLCTLRGLFSFKKRKSIPLSDVEPASDIVKRFVTGAMSFGSISREAHETLALAMNYLGAMSNSGEGGEDSARYTKKVNGTSLCSAIKQVASGRFGVTAEYLASAREIQIKISQGAKPGEGGQLPGHKVNEIIAKVRHSTPGVTLISPPPHHDIYSIEDLAQLIYDLKNSNPEARISVKLVSEVGVGTVAAGVSKGHADMVLISGHDGGTGASPMTSIKHAGLPWELGLAETQQTLVLNKLRSRIRVQVDGQMKTGRDVLIGAVLGAEEFGFATAALVVCGCVMMRKCHNNTCPVGIATQDPELRKHFTGRPEYLVNFFLMLAEEVREYLAGLGFRKLDDIVGRSDLLEKNRAIDFWKTKNLDFSAVFSGVNDKKLPVRCREKQEHGIDKAFDVELIKAARPSIAGKRKVKAEFEICNVDRTAGTMLSYHVAKKYGHKGLPKGTVDFTFRGCAGQSFGAFLAHGINFTLIGEANDYVGKGLSGGRIVIKPPEGISYESSENIIAGNVMLYGAICGEMYINGQAGERFAIRNSGAYAVVEGLGDHGCEYMTGGRVVVLGRTGINFGAGMSGGIAYVYDLKNSFDDYCNLDMIDLEPVVEKDDIRELRKMIEKHLKYTGSRKAGEILGDWENKLPKFVKVFPMEYRRVLGLMMKEDAETKRNEPITA